MAPPAVTPGEAPSTAISARLELGAAGCALAGGILAAAAGPLVTFGVLGVLLGIGVFAAAAYRPVFATYAYLGTLPIVAGIDLANLLPLVRPNEALLVLLLAGAILGGYLRYCRGQTIPFRLHRLDVSLAVFVLLATVWPLASVMLRGQLPLTTTDVAAVLPICKLVAIYLLVRFTIATEAQLVRCLRLIVWSGAVVAVIAILQTLQFGPVPASPIATGDYIIVCLVLVLCCGARGLLHRRERLALGLVLGTGALAFVGRPGGFADLDLLIGRLWRWDDLSNLSIPEFGLLDLLTGVSPTPVLDGPETWRDGIYLESGYLQFLWIGGLPLLVAFGWLSVAALRRTRELASHPGAVGATASALEICWWLLLILTVVDLHLTMTGTGDLLFTMLAITTGALCVGRDQVEPGRVRRDAVERYS